MQTGDEGIRRLLNGKRYTVKVYSVLYDVLSISAATCGQNYRCQRVTQKYVLVISDTAYRLYVA